MIFAASSYEEILAELDGVQDDHNTRLQSYREVYDCLKLPLWQRPEATEVDHKDGLGPLGPRGHDHGNLRAMTHDHHSKRTAADQPGGWNRRRGPAT